MRRAAIDIGTVTTRLLVADVVGCEVTEVERSTVVTHLGEGLHDTGRLSEAAIGRVAAAMVGFDSIMQRTGFDEVVVVATSAARDAENADDLRSRLPVAPGVISGALEARLSFTGATYAIDDDDILVIDLGGGSTELVFGSSRTVGGRHEVSIEAARSFDVGSRRVRDMFLLSDPPMYPEAELAGAWVAEELRPFFTGLRTRPRTAVALAGTGTTLSAIKQGLAVYDPGLVHGSQLSGGDIAGMLEDLARLPLAERRNVVGMDPERADVIVAGALILQTVLALAGVDSTVVSEHDILYGLVLEGCAGS